MRGYASLARPLVAMLLPLTVSQQPTRDAMVGMSTSRHSSTRPARGSGSVARWAPSPVGTARALRAYQHVSARAGGGHSIMAEIRARGGAGPSAMARDEAERVELGVELACDAVEQAECPPDQEQIGRNRADARAEAAPEGQGILRARPRLAEDDAN